MGGWLRLAPRALAEKHIWHFLGISLDSHLSTSSFLEMIRPRIPPGLRCGTRDQGANQPAFDPGHLGWSA